MLTDHSRDLSMVTAEIFYEKQKFISEKNQKKQTFSVADPRTLMWGNNKS